MKRSILTFLFLLIPAISFSQSLKKTEVLILGTPHLKQIDNFEPSHLKTVLKSLESRDFDVIAIEQMPAELLLDIKKRDKEYWQELYQVFSKFIELGQSHQERLDISFDQAENKLIDLHRKTELSDSDRIDYINSYICTYDIWSAVLHYKQLSDKSGLSEEVIELLDDLSTSLDEVNNIAIELAISEELHQIHYIDNLQDETILLNEFPQFITDYQNNANSISELLNQSNIYQKIDSLQNEAVSNNDLYPLYKFFNSSEYMSNDFDAQWGLWFKTDFESKTDRSRYSLWEMRNLSISANILRVIASNPEKRVLVIIGASHKSFIEKYLRQIPDIELLEF